MNKEFFALLDYFEKEKGLERSVVLDVMKKSLVEVAKKSLGEEENISVTICPKACEVEIFVEKEIIDSFDEEEGQAGKISIDAARELDPDCETGQFIDIPISINSLGRIAARNMRHIMMQKFSEIEKELIYEKYQHQIGKLVTGIYKQTVRGNNVILSLGKVDAVLPGMHYSKIRMFHEDEKVRALLLDMKEKEYGRIEILLSRNDPKFIELLLEEQVPEIQEKVICIEEIVRDPGVRSKVVVKSTESDLDPVGVCIGVRGNRIKQILQELNGERVDIVRYDSSPEQFLRNLFYPLEILSIHEDETTRGAPCFSIIINDEDFSIAMGKKQSNFRLNKRLMKKDIIIWKKKEHSQYIEKQIQFLKSCTHGWLDTRISQKQIDALQIPSLILQETLQNILDAGYITWRMILRAEYTKLANDSESDRGNVQRILEKIVRKSKFLESAHKNHEEEKEEDTSIEREDQ